MRVVVIGGSGHIGTYLVPRLVEAGHEVFNVSRGQQKPYQLHPAWQMVRQITVDRCGGRSPRQLWAADTRSTARCRHRLDLLYAGQRPPLG